jgi:sRNA-binding carbon storage regulator CsrA
MLVLSNSERSREDDDVVIRDKATGRVLCEITLVSVRGTRIQWGFKAPPDVLITRAALDKLHHPAG